VDFSIYQIPLMLFEQKVDELIVRKLGLASRKPDLARWSAMVENFRKPEGEVTVAVVGKYLELHDAYKSIWESLTHAAIANRCKVNVRKVAAEEVERSGMARQMEGVSGILVPGGFGHRGIEGKIRAAQYARECKIPYYGLCLGMQIASIEFARNVCGLAGANSTEFDEKTPHPVIHLMDRQRDVTEKGGTMRLGSYPCRIERDSTAWECYKQDLVRERHRHRFEFNNAYRDAFRAKGMRFSGIWPEGNLVEMVEVVDHPWFVGVQFHPEFQSKPLSPHPLFQGFVKAALEYSRPRTSAAKVTV
jgi:CTP synthase